MSKWMQQAMNNITFDAVGKPISVGDTVWIEINSNSIEAWRVVGYWPETGEVECERPGVGNLKITDGHLCFRYLFDLVTVILGR